MRCKCGKCGGLFFYIFGVTFKEYFELVDES